LKSPHLKIGLVQLAVTGSKKENLQRVISAIDGSESSDLIVFPEYCMGYPNGGMSRAFLKDIAEPLNGPFVSKVAEISKKKQVEVVLPIFEQLNGALFNTAIIIARGRVKGGYRKIHLFDALGYRESDLFRAGTEPLLFSVRSLVFGVVICYDIRFPELVKSEVMSGARTVVVPAAWFRGPLKEEQWQTLLMARAHENTSYVIGVGNANDAFVGRSMVVDPLGVKVLDLGSGDRVGYCEIDDRRVTEAREKLPVLQQSKPSHIRCQQL
jgi:predicted amidohydrolase